MRPFKEWSVVRWAGAHRLIVDSAVAAVIGVVALVVHFHQRQSENITFREPTWWTVALVIAACVPLAWRRRNAIPAVLAVVGVQALLEPLRINGPAWLPSLIALYALGSHASGRARAKALVAIALAVGGVFVAYLLSDEVEWSIVFGILAGISMLVAGYLVGDNMRRRRAEIEDLAARAERAERERELLASHRVTEERTRIARELHDIVAHSVSVMVIQAAAARRNLHRVESAEALLDNIEQTGRETMGELRQILGVLRESGDGGTTPMVPMLCDLDSLVSSIPELDVRLFRSGSLESAPIGVALAAYRVVQEALTNAHRHAGPNVVVDVEVACTDERVDVTVTDDGRGASTGQFEGDGGYGLIGMSERVAAFGGSLTTGPRRTGGWEVKATFPLAAPPAIRELSSPVRELAS